MIDVAREIERLLALDTGEVTPETPILNIDNMDSLSFEMLLLHLERLVGSEKKITPEVFLEWWRVSDIQAWVNEASQ